MEENKTTLDVKNNVEETAPGKVGFEKEVTTDMKDDFAENTITIGEGEKNYVNNKSKKSIKHKKLFIILGAVLLLFIAIAVTGLFLYISEQKMEDRIIASIKDIEDCIDDNNKKIESYNSQIKGYEELSAKYRDDIDNNSFIVSRYEEQAKTYELIANTWNTISSAYARSQYNENMSKAREARTNAAYYVEENSKINSQIQENGTNIAILKKKVELLKEQNESLENEKKEQNELLESKKNK